MYIYIYIDWGFLKRLKTLRSVGSNNNQTRVRERKKTRRGINVIYTRDQLWCFFYVYSWLSLSMFNYGVFLTFIPGYHSRCSVMVFF